VRFGGGRRRGWTRFVAGGRVGFARSCVRLREGRGWNEGKGGGQHVRCAVDVKVDGRVDR